MDSQEAEAGGGGRRPEWAEDKKKTVQSFRLSSFYDVVNIYIKLDKKMKIQYNIHRRKKVKYWKNI